MINSNIDYCENSENEDFKKYAKVFESVTSKHRVYSATFKNLQKKHGKPCKTYKQVDVEEEENEN